MGDNEDVMQAPRTMRAVRLLEAAGPTTSSASRSRPPPRVRAKRSFAFTPQR
jgi:hypothetical protein